MSRIVKPAFALAMLVPLLQGCGPWFYYPIMDALYPGIFRGITTYDKDGISSEDKDRDLAECTHDARHVLASHGERAYYKYLDKCMEVRGYSVGGYI